MIQVALVHRLSKTQTNIDILNFHQLVCQEKCFVWRNVNRHAFPTWNTQVFFPYTCIHNVISSRDYVCFQHTIVLFFLQSRQPSRFRNNIAWLH